MKPTCPLLFLRTLLWCAAWLLIQVRTFASPTVVLTVNPASIAVGESGTISLQVRDATQVGGAPEIMVEGLDIEAAGFQQFSINGNTTAIYNYRVTSETPGTYTIPEVEITVGGEVFKSTPQVLTVTEAPATPSEYEPLLQLEAAKTEIYEGEVLPVDISLLIHSATQLSELPLPQLPRDSFTMNRFQRNPEQTIKQLNGQVYNGFIFRTAVSAMKAGDMKLGPAEAKVELFVPDGGQRSPFGGFSGRQRTIKTKSNPMMIRVKALPLEGRPESFKGAVGRFEVQVQAQQSRVQVGEPIALTLYVAGRGNFASLSAPEMENKDGWRMYDAKQVQENRSLSLEPGQVAYTQVIIPEKVTTQIPSYALTFFDPDQQRYVEQRSQPIPITVTPAEEKSTNASGAVAAASGAKDFADTSKSPPNEDLKGLLTIRSDSGRWQPLTLSQTFIKSEMWLHGAGSVLLLLLLGAGFFRWLRRRAAERPAKQEVVIKGESLFKQLRQEHSSLRKFYGLAGDFLQAWQRENRKPLPAEGALGEAVRRILMRRDFFCYGGAAADQPVPDSEHREVIDDLRKL